MMHTPKIAAQKKQFASILRDKKYFIELLYFNITIAKYSA